MLRHITRRMQVSDVKSVASLFHALAGLQYCPEDDVMQRLVLLSTPHLGKFSRSRMVDTLWALAVFQYPAPEKWFRSATECLASKPGGLQARQVSHW